MMVTEARIFVFGVRLESPRQFFSIYCPRCQNIMPIISIDLFLAFYAGDAVRELQCLGPLLPKLINKDVKLHTYQVPRPAASRSKSTRSKSGIRHMSTICTHAEL